MTWRHGIALICVVLAASVAPWSLAAQQRDVPVQDPSGTGRISGRVETTAPDVRPVRRAIVSLSAAHLRLGRHTVTDDEGRFVFEGLAAGRYELSASRASFVTIAYGATGPGRAGTPLTIESGESRTDLRVLLAPGAIVTGTVRDGGGDPVPSIVVRIEPRVAGSGTTLISRTDDQGVYRFFGLPAGTYVVSARPGAESARSALHAPSDAEVDAALNELRKRRAQPAGTGVPGAVQNIPRMGDPEGSGRAVETVPVYYASGFAPEDATLLTIRAGEERAGVDVTLQMMSTAVLTGRVVMTDGQPPANVSLILTRAARGASPNTNVLRPDGTFRYANVPPGRYVLHARAMPPETMRAATTATPAAPRENVNRPCAFAAETFVVAGTDISDITLAMQPCLTIAGRVEFRSTAGAVSPPNLGPLRVWLQPDPSSGVTVLSTFRRAPAVVGADGRFTLGEFGDVAPGIYELKLDLPGNDSDRGWRLLAATANGRDVLDSPFEIPVNSPPTTLLAVTLTDQRSSLSGFLETAEGRPAFEHSVIVFATNRDWWRAPYRRIRTTRPGINGQYQFRDLPPGDYFLAAVRYLDPDDARDPEFLSQIVSAAVRVTIALGEDKVQSLRTIR